MGAVGLSAATAALPALPPSTEAVGRVEPAVAAELGLPELQGVPVFHGTGDLAGKPYTIYHLPYNLYPISFILYPMPCNLYPIPFTLSPLPYTLYPVPCTRKPIS